MVAAPDFVPLCNSTHYSFGLALNKPDALLSKAKQYNYRTLALTDYNSLSGAVAFINKCNELEIKPVLGLRLVTNGLVYTEQMYSTLLYAMNQDGWRDLIQILKLQQLKVDWLDIARKNNILCVIGQPYSELSCHIADIKRIASLYREAFDKNLYFGLQYTGNNGREIQILRKGAQVYGIKCVALNDTHYTAPEDARTHRILVSNHYRENLSNIEAFLMKIGNPLGALRFFSSNNYHLPSPDELPNVYSDEEIQNTMEMSDRCGAVHLLHPPSPPAFNCPNNLSEIEYLRELCREGWRRKIVNKVDKSVWSSYVDRIKMELGVLEEANLAGYFLIVQDYVRAAHNRGEYAISRGSVGGSLVAYLLDITTIDPIKYDLSFERFYNKGRNQPGKVAMPDIDVDFQPTKRHLTIEYIKEKYGRDRVAQIITFGRMMGRAALKDVLRISSHCSFSQINKITEFIPDEAKISDKLQDMREEYGEASIIKWSLQNLKKKLEEYCVLEDNGELSGDLAPYFEQAIKLEGTIKASGKHAGGLVISREPLANICPLMKDKNSGEFLCGFEFKDAEACGLMKADILGVAVLDKIKGVQNILRGLPADE